MMLFDSNPLQWPMFPVTLFSHFCLVTNSVTEIVRSRGFCGATKKSKTPKSARFRGFVCLCMALSREEGLQGLWSLKGVSLTEQNERFAVAHFFYLGQSLIHVSLKRPTQLDRPGKPTWFGLGLNKKAPIRSGLFHFLLSQRRREFFTLQTLW